MAVYDAVQAEPGTQGFLRRAPWLGLRLIARNPNMSIGLLILGVMGVVAIFAPFIDRYDPLRLAVTDRLMSPNSEHWFGTDSFGRDLYSRTVHGARLSLLVGASVVAVAAVTGEILGLIAGYDRRLDAVIMRIVDGIMAFPGLLLALALIAMLGSSVQNVIIAISVNAIPSIARVVRSSVLSLRERPFVEAARATGSADLADFAGSHRAQHARAGYDSGHVSIRGGDVDRSGTEFHRRRSAGLRAELGQHRQHGQKPTVQRALDRGDSGHIPDDDGPGGEPGGRRS